MSIIHDNHKWHQSLSVTIIPSEHHIPRNQLATNPGTQLVMLTINPNPELVSLEERENSYFEEDDEEFDIFSVSFLSHLS